MRRYPGVAAACLAEWPSLRQSWRIIEELLAVVADSTDDARKQAEIAEAVFVYVLGRVAGERGLASGAAGTRAFPADVRARRYPRLAAVRAEFTSVAAQRHFTVGLDALLTGLLEERVA